MAKLRHLAFYERCFDMKRVNKVSAPIGDAVVLSDGVMNLTLLNFPEGAKGMLNGSNWACIISDSWSTISNGHKKRWKRKAASFL
jgi:hypothetical protein